MTDIDSDKQIGGLIADAITTAFASKDMYVLMNIAHSLNIFDDRKAAFHYLKDTGIIK